MIADINLIGGGGSSIKTGTLNGNTSANGNINLAAIAPTTSLILAVHATETDKVCIAYPSGDRQSYWVHVRNANSEGSVYSGSVHLTYYYVDIS